MTSLIGSRRIAPSNRTGRRSSAGSAPAPGSATPSAGGPDDQRTRRSERRFDAAWGIGLTASGGLRFTNHHSRFRKVSLDSGGLMRGSRNGLSSGRAVGPSGGGRYRDCATTRPRDYVLISPLRTAQTAASTLPLTPSFR